MTPPLLACVVLSLADQATLTDAVKSVLEQEEPAELVVVNSGGGDPAGRLRAAGLDVPVIDRAERLYPGAARNLGLDATSAPYISFLAADCIALPGWLRGRIREHSAGAAAVAGGAVPANPESASARAAARYLHSTLDPRAGTPAERRFGLSYARRLFERYGRFREDLRAGEDTELNARIAATERIVWAPDVVLAHRYPTRPAAMLGDVFRRGQLRTAMTRLRAGERPHDGPTRTAISALRKPVWIVRSSRRDGAVECAGQLRDWPLVVLCGVAFAAGALSEPWLGYEGREASVDVT